MGWKNLDLTKMFVTMKFNRTGAGASPVPGFGVSCV